MSNRTAWLWPLVWALALGLALGGPALADPAAGLAWLRDRVAADGSLQGEADALVLPSPARAEAAAALALDDAAPAALLAGLGAPPDDGEPTEFLAHRLWALKLAGGTSLPPLEATLKARRNPDGGYGANPGDRSDPLDTAFALLALRAIDPIDPGIADTLTYLVSATGPGGGYGFPDSPSASPAYVTAYALLAMQSFSQGYSLASPISTARQWLVARQDGGAYGDTVTNAVAAWALMSTTQDTAAFAGAVEALGAAQRSDGSWGGDPYVTALAVRVLSLAANPGDGPAPTTGTLAGLVLDGASRIPLAGARISLGGLPDLTADTEAAGRFMLGGVPPGTHTVVVQQTGYATVTLTEVVVAAGNTTNLGSIALAIDPMTATLRGKVTDGASGAPLPGATLTLAGDATGTATTDARGDYQFAGLPPGGVTITVAKIGYAAVAATATLAGGGMGFFSPSLYAAGAEPTTATLLGRVVDASDGQPLSGATVAVPGRTASTDAAGEFTLADLPAGAFSATVNAAGHDGAILSGTLANGPNDVGAIRLAPIAAAVATGTVRDGATGQPLAGATVRAPDALAVTDTDGRYQLTGLPEGAFSLAASAPGYVSQTATATARPGDHILADFTLNPSPPASGLRLAGVATDHPAYDPYSQVRLNVTVDNDADQPADAIFNATILDSDSKVVAEVPAIQLVLGQPLSAAAQRVAAHGRLALT